MPTRLVVPDYNQLYADTRNTVLINDLPYITKEDREAVTALLMTTYTDTDVLSNIPTCGCGETTGGDNLDRSCKHCKGVVAYPGEDTVEFKVWVAVPDGIDGFMVPQIFHKLHRLLGSGSYSVLNYILESKSVPPSSTSKTLQAKIAYLEKINFPRGINNFIKYFNDFIDILPIISNKMGRDYGKYLLTIPKEKIFPKVLPMPTKAMVILENTPVGSWSDRRTVKGAIDAARTISSMYKPRLRELTQYQKEVKVVSVLYSLVSYYSNTISTTFCSKKGWYRGQLFSSRAQFSLRGVIISLSVPHCARELHIPWAQGLVIFEVFLEIKLVDRGYTQYEALNLLRSCGNVYHPLLDELMNEVISEAQIDDDQPGEFDREALYTEDLIVDIYPRFGVSVTFQRNCQGVIVNK